ncbi:Clusterin-associated protein 1 [Blyttiomyces sp. JEL0837]|nr:Clusterin-associated protein 1 [Blyttiomyces sp. JEL0837]
MADGYAVKELLKLASILYEASTTRADHEETMEVSVNSAVGNLKDQIGSTKHGLENLGADEHNLMSKIEKKKAELDRAEKRLKSLQGVRPAYMDEYEKIEVDLSKLYDVYMEKFRNLTFLEQQLDEYNRQEQDKFEETEMSLKRMQNRLREEEMRMLRGDKELKDSVGMSSKGSRPKRPHAAGRRRRVSKEPADSDSDNLDGANDSDDEDVSLGSGISEDEDTPEAPTGTRDIIDDPRATSTSSRAKFKVGGGGTSGGGAGAGGRKPGSSLKERDLGGESDGEMEIGGDEMDDDDNEMDGEGDELDGDEMDDGEGEIDGDEMEDGEGEESENDNDF